MATREQREQEVEVLWHQLEQRWDFLRPWCGPLWGKVRLLVVKDKDSALPSVGMGVELMPSMTPPTLVGIRQALVLLSVLSKVDRVAFMRAMLSYCYLLDLTHSDYAAIAEAPEPVFIELALADPGGAIGDRDKLATVLHKFFLPDCSPVSTTNIVETTTRGSTVSKVFKLSGGDYANAARRVVWDIDSGRYKLDLPVRIKVGRRNGNSNTEFTGMIVQVLLHVRSAFAGWRFRLSRPFIDSNFDWALRIDRLQFEIPSPRLTPSSAKAYEELVTTGSGLTVPNLQVSCGGFRRVH